MESLHIKLLIIIAALALPIAAYTISNGLFPKINGMNLSTVVLLSIGVIGLYIFGNQPSRVEKKGDHDQCDPAGLPCL